MEIGGIGMGGMRKEGRAVGCWKLLDGIGYGGSGAAMWVGKGVGGVVMDWVGRRGGGQQDYVVVIAGCVT